MRIAIGLLAVTAACGDDGGMFPVGGGGNDGGFTLPDSGPRIDGAPLVDGAVGDGAVLLVDAALFDGRVCLLTDVRDMDDCATTGAAGLTVRLGTAATTTSADGSFSITAQTGTGLVWRVTGPNIVSSFEVLADYQIPAITTTAFNAMKAGSTPTVMELPGEGSLMLYASSNGAAVAGVTATTTPAFYFAYYDGATQAAWEQDSTGPEGGIWIPGIDVGSVTYDAGAVTGTAPIFDGGITFANVINP